MAGASAQQVPLSVHFEQNKYYSRFGDQKASFYDSISGSSGRMMHDIDSGCQLQRVVFGFHPYWAGSDYLNYQWNLLSDLCYFSYEVDPSSGEPVTIHDWLDDPAIDSAQAHGTRVHLCATIFSGHAAFFNNPTARQTLITNLISLVQARDADGVNMDIEALPSSVSDSMTAFMQDLSLQLKAAIPGAMLSIDLPAVDWNNNFQIDSLSNYLDWFFIMGYDYYWNGSAEAGPVSPLYSLTSSYNYSLARSVSAYQASGIPEDKFILGIPYYGRQWKTASNSVPSPVLANGTALTYANVRNNSGTYNGETYHWDHNSHSSCYIFYQNSSWYQCFIGLDRDLRKKYDLVNYRDLAGIGIWALGYDDGYSELWDAISDKFSDCYVPLAYDTIYDSGGPAWNYYDHEFYMMTIDHNFNEERFLTFSDLSLEADYDSLWIYAGPDTSFALLGAFSGNELPETLSSANGAFTLMFHSDGLQTAPGWEAVFHDGSLGLPQHHNSMNAQMLIFPNPAHDIIFLHLDNHDNDDIVMIFDMNGRPVYTYKCNDSLIAIDVSSWDAGVYYVMLSVSKQSKTIGAFIKSH
jgi:hypothetical protein